MQSISALLLMTAAIFCSVLIANSQSFGQGQRTAILESRVVDKLTGADNYTLAAYSFEKGANGPEAFSVTCSVWDIYFYTYRRNDGLVVKDVLDVSMVVDDRSRIKDLGPLEWNALGKLPRLAAYESAAREKPVEAIVGHIYLVHTADRDSDTYTLFRVDELISGERVSITWIPSYLVQGILKY
ncbi:MAG: hypothetical protein ABI539_01000 [Acidobacteriota bacterium]